MKIDVLKKNDNEIQFLVEGIKPSFASALRRIMMSEIPTMAVEWVEFKKNDSALNDEVVANRLGLVPLTFDPKAYNVNATCEKCKGKGCSRCQVKLVLKKKGPAVVYSKDLKSTAKDVKPAFDNIPITELFEGQDIEFEATAQLGFGKDHVKWQGAVVGYKNKANVIVPKDLEAKKEYIQSCPVDVFEAHGSKIVAERPMDCILCMQCVEASNGKIKIEAVEDSFIFNVETASGLTADEVVSTAAEILGSKMGEFGKAVKKVK